MLIIWVAMPWDLEDVTNVSKKYTAPIFRNEDWIHVVHNTDQWQVPVNVVLNLWAP
jgi:hypothetical protein